MESSVNMAEKGWVWVQEENPDLEQVSAGADIHTNRDVGPRQAVWGSH